ncbi:NRT1/PTR family MFS transporter [Proteobacteria bacterium 005FR1]|nr:NRT1/PTR family MFS transporter [Proteobacteria bacterium 005FR1]
MLNREAVEAEDERLSELAAQLPAPQRKDFYRALSRRLKDPDTYAALNWFFLAGLHHFYLGRWWWGAIDLAVFIIGVSLLFLQQYLPGILLILVISAIELWALFRAQVIVQDWNNRLTRDLLKQHGVEAARHHSGRR